MTRKTDDSPILVKKYANRRLYNTATSAYVTLDDLYDMVKTEQEFEVRDAKSNEDLTRQVLTQIIFERESKDGQLLPEAFLKQLIRFYDQQQFQHMVPSFLDKSLNWFHSNRERWQGMMEQSGMPMAKELSDNIQQPLEQWENIARQQIQWFEQAVDLMTTMPGAKESDKD